METPKKPKSDTVGFEVRTGAGTFRRAGIEFTTQPTIVDASSMTEEQKVELLNTPGLEVTELADRGRMKDAAKASQPSNAPAAPVRAPAPVPAPPAPSDDHKGRGK